MTDVKITPQDIGYPANGVNANLLGEQLTPIGVSTGGYGIVLHLADIADEANARAIVSSHDARAKSQAETDAEARATRRARLRARLDGDTLSASDLADIVRELLR